MADGGLGLGRGRWGWRRKKGRLEMGWGCRLTGRDEIMKVKKRNLNAWFVVYAWIH